VKKENKEKQGKDKKHQKDTKDKEKAAGEMKTHDEAAKSTLAAQHAWETGPF